MILDRTNLSASQKLILLCLQNQRTQDDRNAFIRLSNAIIQEDLLRIATAHQVQHAVADAMITELGEAAVIVQLKTLAHNNAQRVTYMESQAVEFTRRMREHNAPLALFESAGVLFGSNLSRTAFGSSDFDFLIAPSHLDLACRTLIELGLKLSTRNSRVQVERREFVGTTPEGLKYWFDICSKPFERRFFSIPYPNPVCKWLESKVPSAKNAELFVLKPENSLTLLSVHTSLHSYIRSPGLRLHVDVDRIVRDNVINWDEYIAELHSLRFTHRAHFSLTISNALFGTPVPPRIIQLTEPGSIQRATVNWIIRKRLFPKKGKPSTLPPLEVLALDWAISNPNPVSSWTKRALDIFASVVGLAVALPILITAAICIRVTLGTPILFRQARAGLYGRQFTIYKLRTMHVPSPTEQWHRTDQVRLTRLGRFLRATSIDELPTLINVLLGDMSLVGPRPLLMEYLPKYTSEELRRHDIKPGITGLAQIHGRQNIPFSTRLAFDIVYNDSWTLKLDLVILVKTLCLILFGTGVVSGQNVDVVDDIGLSTDRLRSEMRKSRERQQ